MQDAGSVGPESSQNAASFLRRLAGPSIMKAGLAKDQTEINRVIAEASKGSKFYENEKRKDKDLTERITWILKQRDELIREADINKVEHAVDQLLAKMESQRDLTQIIVHVDMDAFYANVELLDNPDLTGKPFAVGHGVVSTASYEARKHGVRSGMAEFVARKLCPELIVVPIHFPRITELSQQVMGIFKRYDPTMQVAGCDEGYLNITQYCEEHLLAAHECVQEIRATVFRETNLTVSAGIAPNKMLAKICSDKNKPNGQFMLEFNSTDIKKFMNDLSIRKIPGVGRVNERLLESMGIKTCGDIFVHRVAISLMDKQFGLHFLLQTYLGIASNVVQPGQREERKSIGAERTFSAIGDKNKILAKLEEVAAELEEDMERTGWTGKTVTLKYKLDTYEVFTRAKSFDRWISTKKEDLFATGKELLMPELPLKIRLIGLRVTKLKDLRLNTDKEPGSIKRFFESAKPPASPSKKRNSEPKIDDEDSEVEPNLTQDGYEDAMPGYHEEIELDIEELRPEDNLPQRGDDSVMAEKLRPPASSSGAKSHKPASSSSTSNSSRPSKPILHVNSDSSSSKPASKSTSTTKPSSKRKRSLTPNSGRNLQTEICPICEKNWETDNRGLNEHIDFCLSKGAIREAQAMASNQTVLSALQPDSVSRGKPNQTGRKAARKR